MKAIQINQLQRIIVTINFPGIAALTEDIEAAKNHLDDYGLTVRGYERTTPSVVKFTIGTTKLQSAMHTLVGPQFFGWFTNIEIVKD